MRAAEKNRLQAPRAAAIAEDVTSLIADLTRRIRTLQQRIADLIANSRQMHLAEQALRQIPGIGQTIAATLLAGLPELGAMTRQQAAALVGRAPHPRDSGNQRGHRTTRGGRRTLRQPLFLAALTAIRKPGKLAHAYNALLQRGKPKRLALIDIARKIVVIANAKVRDARRDFLHKASTDLVRRFDAIAVEDLAVANMVRNRSLAKAISRTGWAEFREMLAYKAHRDGRTLAVVDRWYPSSKTCSACGHLLSKLSLGTRHWTCPGCGTRHDRDINAAKNIAVAAGLVETINACGADVRHGGQPSVRSAVNQEPQRATAGTPSP